MTTLLIIKELMDDKAPGAYFMGGEADILLIQDGVYMNQEKMNGKVFLLRKDCEQRGVLTDKVTLSYDEMVKLIFEYDKVISW